MNVRVKICGVSTPGDVAAAVEHGADALGFVLADSPRRVTIEAAARLARALPPFIARVAVFRHPRPDDVRRAIEGFHPQVVQTEPDAAIEAIVPSGVQFVPVLHDGESLLEDAARYIGHETGAVGAVLLEAAGRGGRGVSPNWERAADLARRIPLVLAGGLTPDNVGDALRRVRPFAVDVSSGVETSPGRKDPKRIAAFIHAVRTAERHLRPAMEALA